MSGHNPQLNRGVSLKTCLFSRILYKGTLHDFDTQQEEYVGELAQRGIKMFDKAVTMLRFNNHIIQSIYISSIFPVS